MLVSSQNTNIATRSSASTRPSMASMNTSR